MIQIIGLVAYTGRKCDPQGGDDLAGIIPDGSRNADDAFDGFLFFQNVTLVANLLQAPAVRCCIGNREGGLGVQRIIC